MSLSLSKPLLVLPAAGYGTRVGNPNSKEIFLGPSGYPLIEASLYQARLRNWPVHVITRKEKTDLISYLLEYQKKYFNADQADGFKIEVQIIEPSREWPDTLLQSQKYWHSVNLLCLPDTIYEPEDIWYKLVEDVQQGLLKGRSNVISAALFSPDDLSKWGVMLGGDSQLLLCEKPDVRSLNSDPIVANHDFNQTNQKNYLQNEQVKAWGLIAFSQSIGEQLFRSQLESTFDHKWKSVQTDFSFHHLKMFKDLTRG